MVEMVLVFVGVAHFKVAVWRICGYHIEPYFNKPWLATNLMAFWTRYGYYYREFLVRAFYYPVFFRLSSLPPAMRIVIAGLAAAGLGNLITHLIKQNLQHGMQLDSFSYVLSTWPYFLLLGLGIGVSMVVMRRRKRQRKPWTPDRWFIVDLLAVYVTIQYFSLIHVFARPTEASSLEDLFQLFMLGLGIDLR
jgi:D-alanyl-lipoteichoic acid acyltransferase DltB (MBOAT superfamily)